MDDDVERQAPHGDNKIISMAKKGWCVVGIATTVTIVIMVCIFVPIFHFMVDTQYTIAIDSASSLDPKAGVSFNITLGVVSRSHGAKACINPGMYVDVFYRGVQVAAGDTVPRRTCAGPRRTVEVPVVARAVGVPVEEHVLVSLDADMRQGTAMFDARLYVPEGSYGRYAAEVPLVTGCKRTRVGDAAVMCDAPSQS